MNLADVQTLLEYHYWARDIMLDAVTMVSSEQFTQPVESSFRSLRDTVAHLYGAELTWYRRWIGESPSAQIAYDQFPDVSSIRTAWTDLEGNVRALVDSLGEEGMSRMVEYTLFSGAAGATPFWQMLAHVVNHGSYHRGQVTTLVRQLGAPPSKATDMIAFFRARGPR